MRTHLMSCILVSFVVVIGCNSSHPTEMTVPTNAKHVSLGVFEVVDCAKGMVPMRLKDSEEKYCLAPKPVVVETDVTLARASLDETRTVRLLIYLTSEAGQRMKEITERINQRHLGRNDYGKMAIVIDGALRFVPTIRGTLSDQIAIDGAFSFEEATQIADSLNASRRPRTSPSTEQK